MMSVNAVVGRKKSTGAPAAPSSQAARADKFVASSPAPNTAAPKFIAATAAPAAKASASVPSVSPKPHSAGFDPNNIDPTVKPGDDFFHYANGGWIKNNPIPDELPRWGQFMAVNEANLATLNDILSKAAADPAPADANTRKLGDFYAAAMDTDAIEKAGLTPLKAELDRIDSMQNLTDLGNEIAHLHSEGIPAFFVFGSTPDAKNSTSVIGEADQGGLGLPDRDYYTKIDDKSSALRKAYVDHMANMFTLMGDDPATARNHAQTVMLIETQLAVASRTNVELRDPESNYNITDRPGLSKLTPSFDWGAYFKNVGAPDLPSINVGQPEFFQATDKLMSSTPLPAIKQYLKWQLINNTAKYLSSKFVDEDFHFKGTVMQGTQVNRPRWKRVVGEADAALGEALGQAFVQQKFTPEAKQRATDMVNNLKATLRDDLSTLSWMSPATRQAAIDKMDAFMQKIGYPDQWRDYSSLQVDRGSYLSNALNAKKFAVSRDLNKIGKPVDRTEWQMTPPTVNAYYNPLMNEIVFPAGILQPPFFNPDADDAVNYGAIGMVIGHEMTHGFDDQGAQFDPQGNLRNWWTAEDLKNFQAKTTEVANEYSGFEVEPGLHVNGPLVTGEATADLGGLTIAWKAYQKSLEGKPAPAPIDGFTGAQRFFLGFAQIWAESRRPEFARLMVKTDPHPPPQFRVNGTLENMPQFAEAFGLKPGDPMVLPPDKRITIW
jgi:putative endopeptidase